MMHDAVIGAENETNSTEKITALENNTKNFISSKYKYINSNLILPLLAN